MKTTLLRLSRRAACLVLAGGLLTSCSLLPAASPRHEGTAASQAPQYYSDAWLSDDSLHYVYSYVGNGGGTILRGGRVLYKASSSDSIQLLKDTLTGETGHYLVAHSTPGTEERTSTLYDADGNAVMTFPYAVNATLSGGLLILRDDADVWAFENGTTGGTRVYDLATGAQLPVPETALDCLVVDEGVQRLVFNCYDLPEGLTYAYDDPDQPLHQYVLITDREGNVLLREDGCTASSLASYRGGFADWLDLSWFRGSDWGIAREALYNVTTGELLTGEDDSAVSACGVGVACLQSRQDSCSVLYDLNGSEAVELGRFDWSVNTYTPGCVVLSGSDDPDSPYTLIDLASGESIGVQRRDTDYRSGNVAVLTTDNILKVYDGTTGALLTDVEAAPVEEAQYISVTALPDGYALLQYDDENYNTIAIQTYGGEGLLWSSAGEAQQYTYASYLTSTASGPLLTACRDSRDGSSLYDVLDMEGDLLLRRLGSALRVARVYIRQRVAPLHPVADLLLQQQTHRQVDLRPLRRPAAAQVHAHKAHALGVDVVYITRLLCLRLDDHRRLRQQRRVIHSPVVAALRTHELRHFLERGAALYAVHEPLPRLGVARGHARLSEYA